MKDIDTLSTNEIENYLRDRKNAEYEKKRRLEMALKTQFSDSTDVTIYEASDYCGVEIGQHSFYYGYEVTKGDEWCFTAKFGGALEMKLPTSKLWYIPDADIMWYLVSGMAQYIQRQESGRSPEALSSVGGSDE